MNNFVSRAEPVTPVANVQPRSVPVVAQAGSIKAGDEAPGSSNRGEASAAKANYARIRENIAREISTLQSQQPSATAADMGNAEQAMLGMIRQPIVALPLPPADPDMIQFVAQIALSLAQQHVRSQVAQARVSHETVDALVN